jgi:hypothetical protein
MVRDTSTGNGKVVVNRTMSLDGFTAGPGDAMDWIFDYMRAEQFPEIMAATGAMLIGRRTYEVGKRLAGEPGNEPAYDGGPEFVLTHEPPDPAVTFLTGDIGEAVQAARVNVELPERSCRRRLQSLGYEQCDACLWRRARSQSTEPTSAYVNCSSLQGCCVSPGSASSAASRLQIRLQTGALTWDY